MINKIVNSMAEAMAGVKDGLYAEGLKALLSVGTVPVGVMARTIKVARASAVLSPLSVCRAPAAMELM